MLHINVETNMGGGETQNYILGVVAIVDHTSLVIILLAILDGSHYKKSQKWQL